MPDTHRFQVGLDTQLSKMSTRGKDFHKSRSDAEAEFLALQDELIQLQARLYAEGRRSLLVVLQAMDAGGKDSTIRRIFSGVNPQGVRVTSFKEPSKRELSHDFLWRIHREVPPAGMIGIFNRSHYEDVLVTRVENLVPEDVWRLRYDHINSFERLLVDSDVTILKFMLHISKAEQQERFEERLTHPEKHWKFSPQDIVKRRHWESYMEAYDDVLAHCSTEWAPWYVIPADQKWYRNLAISRVIVQTLRELDPQYPPPIENLDEYREW
jgi:PPK2 family polyphosphate:nucleotide phosphotransferase